MWPVTTVQAALPYVKATGLSNKRAQGFGHALNLAWRCQRRWGEIVSATVVMLCSVLIQAYILGTLFHYLVKRDPKLEAFRCGWPLLRASALSACFLSHAHKLCS